MAHKSTLISAVLLLLTVSFASASFTISQLQGDGTSLFGLRNDGSNMGEGQTFYLPDGGSVTHAQARFRVPYGAYDGIPPMRPDEPIRAGIRALDGTPYDLTTSLLSFANGVDGTDPWGKYTWMDFDFGADAPWLAPGQYMLTFHTPVPKWASICYAETGDPYTDGGRMRSYDGGTGPWTNTTLTPTQDLAFSITVTPELPPGALVLLGMVPIGIAWWRRRKE